MGLGVSWGSLTLALFCPRSILSLLSVRSYSQTDHRSLFHSKLLPIPKFLLLFWQNKIKFLKNNIFVWMYFVSKCVYILKLSQLKLKNILPYKDSHFKTNCNNCTDIHGSLWYFNLQSGFTTKVDYLQRHTQLFPQNNNI